MKRYLIFIGAIFLCARLEAQVIEVDLADTSRPVRSIDTDIKPFKLINRVPSRKYHPVWILENRQEPAFDLSILTLSEKTQKALRAGCTADQAIDTIRTEQEIRNTVKKLSKEIGQGDHPECDQKYYEAIERTKAEINFPFYKKLHNNQFIFLTIYVYDTAGNNRDTLNYTFKTPEKSRWLIHYGLTYSPHLLSKTDQYYTRADTGLANSYTILRNNRSGAKPWDNLSATINFTYPFQLNNRSFRPGFTSGFGLGQDFQLSGMAGLSAIVGDNIILSSGVIFLQRYSLKGQYINNEVVKSQLDFSALHERVWLPEIYFTLGFRFGKDSFGSANRSPTPSESEKE